MYKYSPKNPQGEYDSVIRLADNKVIQLNESDLLYKAVKLWISRGNEPAPPDPEQVAPVQETPVEEAKDTPSEAENVSEDVVQPSDEPNPRSKKTKPWRELLDKK